MTCAWRGSCCRAGNSWRHTAPSSAPHGSVRSCSHFRLMVPGAFDPHVSLDVWPPPRSTHPPPQTSCGSRLYSLQSDGHSALCLAPSLPPDAPFFNLLHPCRVSHGGSRCCRFPLAVRATIVPMVMLGSHVGFLACGWVVARLQRGYTVPHLAQCIGNLGIYQASVATSPLRYNLSSCHFQLTLAQMIVLCLQASPSWLCHRCTSAVR